MKRFPSDYEVPRTTLLAASNVSIEVCRSRKYSSSVNGRRRVETITRSTKKVNRRRESGYRVVPPHFGCFAFYFLISLEIKFELK